MALTLSVVKRNVVGAQKEAVVDATFDSSYADGGESFIPRDIDPAANSAEKFLFVGATMKEAADADQRLVNYDYAAGTLRLFTAITTEATGDQSTISVRCLVRYGASSG